MGDYFYLVEQSRHRRCALLAEAARDRRVAEVRDAGLRQGLATLLIKLAFWLAPASAAGRGPVVLHDERAVARIARI